MKLVKGHTLAHLLAQRPDPAAELARFLSVFEAVCQTVAYAHARGVIHRDLKPSNVMMGSFGEVQVMDWGLAKVLPRGGVVDDATAGKTRDETVIATARSGSDAGLSRAGSAMGTPAYMAPEQARGEVDRIDERADVFALGSILAEVLTGRPAFAGRTSGEIQRKAARADTGEALGRLDACGVDAELIGLARDCLAVEPDDRPLDASAVAGRVTAHLSGVQERLRRAERDRAAAEARAAEQAKRQRVQAALGLTFTGLVLMGGAFAWWTLDQRRSRRLEAERAVNRAVEGAVAAFGQAKGGGANPALWGAARAAALQARDRAVDAPAEVRARVDGLIAEIDQLEKNRRLVATLLEPQASIGDEIASKDFHGANARYGRAFRDYGVDLPRMAPDAAAELLRKLGGDSTVEIAAALDDWAYVRRRIDRAGRTTLLRLPPDDTPIEPPSLFAITRLLDPDPVRNRIRDAAASNDAPTLAALAREVDPSAHPSQTVNLLSLYLFWMGQRDEAARFLRAAQPHHPGNYPINIHVAYFQMQVGRPAEALPYAMAALALRPHSAEASNLLAGCLERLGRDGEALAEYTRLVRRRPSQWPTILPFGRAMDGKGDHEKAAAAFRAAVEAALDHPTETLNFLSYSPDPPGRRSSLTDALIAPLRERAAARPESGEARLTLATFLWCAGRMPEAMAAYRESIARLASDPAHAFLQLGNILLVSGDVPDAIEILREAVRLKPNDAEARSDLGNALRLSADWPDAAASLREAIRLRPEHAKAHYLLGTVLKSQGRYAEALAELRRGHKLGSRQFGWFLFFNSAAQVAEAERLAPLAERLPAILGGTARLEDNADRLAVAQMGYDTKHYAGAARLWGEALEADPKVADDRQIQPRYNAACAAALAAAGKGDDAPADAEARAALRARALGWLKDELAAWAKLLEPGATVSRPNAVRSLLHWKKDGDLAGVRDADVLARLPEAERKDWQALWAVVDRLLGDAEKAR